MKLKKKYKDLNETLLYLKKQAREGISYCYDITEGINSPEELFNYLKMITIYRSDPPGTELLQTPQTLFENNSHGESGAGDCDDFAILSLACLYCLDSRLRLFVTLAGNTNVSPSHVYVSLIKGGTLYSFDLTTATFNTERKYKFTQFLECKL